MLETQLQPSERERRIQEARHQKFIRRTLWTFVVLVILGGGAVALFWFGSRPSDEPGTAIPDQGRSHVALGTAFEYNSNPPTSGPHTAQVYEWDVYPQELTDQTAIHNLEHGGIWIAYRPTVASGTVEKLSAIAREFGRKVLMAPRSANDSDIALAAWNHLDKFSEAEFSEERVRAFIRTYRNRGPEFVP